MVLSPTKFRNTGERADWGGRKETSSRQDTYFRCLWIKCRKKWSLFYGVWIFLFCLELGGVSSFCLVFVYLCIRLKVTLYWIIYLCTTWCLPYAGRREVCVARWRSKDLRDRQVWGVKCTCAITSCVARSEALHFSEPYYLPTQNGENIPT